MKKKILKRQPLYDILAVALVLLGAFTVQVVYAGYFESATEENARLTQEVSLKSALVESGDPKEIVDRMQEYVPQDSQRSGLTGTVSQWAGSHNITLVGIDFSEAPRGQSAEDSPTSELELFQATARRETVRIQVRGQEQSILAFLQQLENAPRLIDVTAVSYSDGNTGVDLVGSIEAYTYYQ